jgi:predicted deacylase
VILRLHRFAALEPGPSLLVLGAVHGNETCGTHASARVIEALDSGALVLRRGAVTFLPVTNPLAYRLQRRVGDRNLNRNLRPKATPLDFEDRVGNVLCDLLASHEVLLDLHSFQAPAAPFVMTGTTAPDSPEWAFARSLGVGRCVTGWMEVYADGVRRRQQAGVRSDPGLTDLQYGVGTTEYLRACGGYGVTLECGQHDDPSAVDVAEQAIRRALAFLGMTDAARPAPADCELLRLTEVIDREHADDGFVAEWSSFSRVVAGELVARRHDGRQIRAATDGCIMFPSRLAAPGHEWFYFARRET